MLRPGVAVEPLPSRFTLPPATIAVADALIFAVGATALTAIVVLALDCWPTLSVTVSWTVKLPLPLPEVATVAVLEVVPEVKLAIELPLAIAHW